MKKKKYLPLYYEWMEQGRIPFVYAKRTDGGLCSIFEDDELFDLCKYDGDDGYWGFEEDQEEFSFRDVATEFTPLRQTIVLFCAALNGEL